MPAFRPRHHLSHHHIWPAPLHRLHHEVLLQLLIYIRNNNNLILKYYSNIEDAPLSDLLRQAGINYDNQLMLFSVSKWQDFPDTGRSIVSYFVFYQGGQINRCTCVTGTIKQSSAENDYNTPCTAVMALACFRIINNELMNKYPYVFPEELHIIILDGKPAVYMANNGKDKKNTRHISRRIHLIRNGEY